MFISNISNPKRWCCESATLNTPANLENSAVATGLENVSFHSTPKGNAKECSSSVQFSSVAQSCLTFCNPRDCSTTGFSVLHQLLEPTQTHVHWVSDAIQPSHPLSFPFSSCLQSFPSSGSFPMSRFFPLGGQSFGASVSASVLQMNIQDWFPLGLTGLIFFQFKGLSRVFSNTIVQEYQLFASQPSLWSNSHTHTWLLEEP